MSRIRRVGRGRVLLVACWLALVVALALLVEPQRDDRLGSPARCATVLVSDGLAVCLERR